MKKFLSLLLCLIFSASLVSCGSSNSSEDNLSSSGNSEIILPDFKGEPEYNGNEEILISGFWAPKHELEQFQRIKDAGFTHIYLEEKYGKHGSENYCKALELAEKVGIKVIAQRMDKNKSLFSDPTDYSKYPAFAGYNAYDEPHKDKVSLLSVDLEEFNEKYKGRNDISFFHNLLPHYATPDQTGFDDFYRYIDHFAKNISSKITAGKKILSVDSYPLVYSRGKNMLMAGHLSSLEAVANSSRKYGLEPYFFIQDMSFGKHHRAPLKEDFDLQTYICLAFGMRGIQHFTYMTPQEGPGGEFTYDKDGNLQLGLIDREGNKTERWEYAKSINQEIKKFQNVYMDFKWDGVMTVEGSEYSKTGDFISLREPIKSHERIDSWTATGDTVLGCFTDKNGYQGFMITPYIETTDKFSTNVEINFRKAEKAVLYIDGEKSIVDLVDGQLKLTIKPGEGVFAIPFNV